LHKEELTNDHQHLWAAGRAALYSHGKGLAVMVTLVTRVCVNCRREFSLRADLQRQNCSLTCAAIGREEQKSLERACARAGVVRRQALDIREEKGE